VTPLTYAHFWYLCEIFWVLYIAYTLRKKTPTLKQKKQLGPQPDSSSSERVGDSNRILGGSRQEKGAENAETYTTVYVYIMIDNVCLKKINVTIIYN